MCTCHGVFSRMGLVSVGSGSIAVVYCSGISVLKVHASKLLILQTLTGFHMTLTAFTA